MNENEGFGPLPFWTELPDRFTQYKALLEDKDDHVPDQLVSCKTNYERRKKLNYLSNK